jgi:hypothetical protein
MEIDSCIPVLDSKIQIATACMLVCVRPPPAGIHFRQANGQSSLGSLLLDRVKSADLIRARRRQQQSTIKQHFFLKQTC